MVLPPWKPVPQTTRQSDHVVWASQGGSGVKNPPANAGHVGLIPGLGRSPGEGNGNPFLCPCPGNTMDRGAWWATVHRVTESQTRLSNKTTTTSTTGSSKSTPRDTPEKNENTRPQINLYTNVHSSTIQVSTHTREYDAAMKRSRALRPAAT